MTFACLLVFVSSFSRIWPSANICLAAKVNSRVFLSRTFAHFSTAARHRAGTFSQQTSYPDSFRQRDSISALHLEKTLARHLGYRCSDDRNADHNERLHHVGDRSHFGTRRTSSSFGPSRSSLTHLRRRERTVDTPPLKDNNRAQLMFAAGRSYLNQRGTPGISNLRSARSRSSVPSSTLRDV